MKKVKGKKGGDGEKRGEAEWREEVYWKMIGQGEEQRGKREKKGMSEGEREGMSIEQR